MHRARRHAHLRHRRQPVLEPLQLLDQGLARQPSRIVVHLQRTDARRQVDDAGVGLRIAPGLQRLHQHMRAHAQGQVQLQRPVLDQQVGVAGLAIDHLRLFAARRPSRDDRIRQGLGLRRDRRRAGDQRLLLRRQQARGLLGPDRHEAQRVTRPQLTELPQLRLHHHRRADEAAEARTVGAEDHRHVAGKVDRANGVGVVVDVRRMQAGLAAVAAGPLGLGPDQTHAGATGVVVHFPVGLEEACDVGIGEEIRGAVRPVQHTDLPLMAVLRPRSRRPLRARFGLTARARSQMQHIADAQRAAGMPAELAERERGFRAEVVRHVEAAVHAQIAATAGVAHGTELEHAAGGGAMHLPRDQRRTVQRGVEFGASQHERRFAIEAQGRPAHRAFERRGTFRIAQQPVADAQRQRIHRPRRRHANVPVADATRPVLDRGLHAGFEHVQRPRAVVERVQVARGLPPFGEHGVGDDLTQIVQIGLDTGDARRRQRVAQLRQRRPAGLAGDDELGQHRVVVRTDLGAGRHRAFDANAVGECDLGQQTGRGLEVLVRVLGVEAHLDRRAGQGRRE